MEAKMSAEGVTEPGQLSTAEIISLCDRHLLRNVGRLPLAFTRGKGLKLWDAEGKVYLDFVAGIATCAFGHAPDFMAETLARQARVLVHVSNLFYTEPMARLAEFLTRASGLDRVFFSNSGAEANEAALKMARKHGSDKSDGRRIRIVSARNSFHGRTMGAISITGQENLHAGFHPLLPGVTFVPFGDLAELDRAVDETVCCVFLEPIQGEGGVEPAPPGYLARAAEIARSRGALLVLDEVQTGLGRTGTDFAFRHFGVRPDILTLGKALGCGYPVAATLSTDSAGEALGPGSHSTTLGGAPLATALALELVTRILEPSFLARVSETGSYFLGRLQELAAKHPDAVQEARGLGLMLGLKLRIPAAPIAQKLVERGFIVNATAGTVLRFVPPLIVTPAEIDLLVDALSAILAAEGQAE
ncbi:MAG: acetylornithine/succinylornithine family transaminase [Deltaproteobacteria bacterium]|jgi:predicted acetylornithine/succinylornithine family transaminase|nr:acetylornithine/succinylornithine family transaminase [Deltaproteobacteria bacterium]